MTILGVPEGGGFTIGTSSNIGAPSGGGGGSMDMSLDDMIKNRRRSTRTSVTKKTASTADKTIGKGRANRKAAMNFRRGITATAKASAMDVEKEVSRQTRQSGGKGGAKKQPGRKARSEADIKVKARQEKKRKQEASKKNKAAGGGGKDDSYMPPAWIGGTRRPPSKKAVTAAVQAMQGAGFQVPKGMQMVISFAPAPDAPPAAAKNTNNNNKGGKKGGAKGGNGNNNGGRGGGGRGKGRR